MVIPKTFVYRFKSLYSYNNHAIIVVFQKINEEVKQTQLYLFSWQIWAQMMLESMRKTCRKKRTTKLVLTCRLDFFFFTIVFILETEKTSFLKFSDKVLKTLVQIEIITGNPLVFGVNTAGRFSSSRQLPRVFTLEPLLIDQLQKKPWSCAFCLRVFSRLFLGLVT